MAASAHSPVGRILSLLRSRLLLSVGAQGLVSGFHFALNIALLRLVTPWEYGMFAFAFVLAMFAGAVNNALISTPLTVYTPVLADAVERRSQEAMFSTLNVLLFVALLVAGLVGSALAGHDASLVIGMAVFVAVYAARQYSRSVGYTHMRPLVTAGGDMTYVVAGSLLIALMALFMRPLPVGYVLLGLAGGNLVAMLFERSRIESPARALLQLAPCGHYGRVWKASKWALAGSLTTLFLMQAHSLIITATNGADAFAPLAAGAVLFGPVRVALLTWQNMVKPELAVQLAAGELPRVGRTVRITSLAMVGAVCLLGAFLWLAWPLVYEIMYVERYADRPMAAIVALWTVITLFAASYNPPSAALQAMKDFRILAMASIYGAVISGVLVALLLIFTRPEWTLFGILGAEAFMAVFIARVLRRRLADGVRSVDVDEFTPDTNEHRPNNRTPGALAPAAGNEAESGSARA